MYLLIDWGNTQLKAILIKELNSVIAHANELQSTSFESAEALLDWLKAKPFETLEYVLIASVREDQQTQQLLQQLGKLSRGHFIAETSTASAGVECAYKDPSKLGIDRWLGMIAGHSKSNSTAIIDIGSAITVDVVDSKGQHLGGHIIPGERLIKASLKLTGKVHAEERDARELGFKLGSTTGECVDFGIQQLVEGYLRLVISELANRHQITKWIFSGGGGLFWKDRLQLANHIITPENSSYQANIVFSGLVIDFLEKTAKAQNTRG